MLAAGVTLPVDLLSRLDAEGYDIPQLEARYAQ
jgi:hypothetical protein